MTSHINQKKLSGSAGISLLELLVVSALIAIVSSFALINFQKSSRNLNLSGAALALSANLEKVRVDSVRRHGGGSINIDSTSSYTVTIDSAGTGTAIAQTITLPVGSRLSYRLPPATNIITPSETPLTIAYDWRGRTANTISLTLTDSTSGGVSNTIVVRDSGDVSTDTTAELVATPTPHNTTVTPATGIKIMQ